MSNDYKGYISREYTMWCGRCAHWERDAARTQHSMARRMRKIGWSFTKECGWVCPRCKKKEDTHAAEHV